MDPEDVMEVDMDFDQDDIEGLLPVHMYPNGAIDPVIVPEIDNDWNASSAQFTTMQGIEQIFARMEVISGRMMREPFVDNASLICLFEAMLRIKPSNKIRSLLCMTLLIFDPEGQNSVVTNRVIQLSRRNMLGTNPDPIACIRLANIYLDGVRMPRDEQMATQIYRMGWMSQDNYAKYTVAMDFVAHLRNLGNHDEALSILEELSDPDRPIEDGMFIETIIDAVLLLVDMLTTGAPGVAVDHVRARNMLQVWVDEQLEHEENRACLQDLDMFQRLAKMYEQGIGGIRDLEEALHYYELIGSTGGYGFEDIRRLCGLLGKDVPLYAVESGSDNEDN